MGPTAVTAFACAVCSTVHALEDDADACCRCTECNGVFPDPVEHHLRRHSICGRCRYSDRVKASRDRVNREQHSLDQAVAEHTKLLNDGRPPALPGARKRKFTPVEGES